MKLGFEKKSGPTKHTTHIHVHGDSQIFFLFLFGPSPFLAIRYSLTKKKKKQCGLWVCFVCNANKELPRSVNSTLSVSQSAMSSLLYIFCIFCSVYFYQRKETEKKLKSLRSQLVSIFVVILVSDSLLV